MELLQEADCVVWVGASLNHYTIESGYLFPEAKFIQIDTAPHLGDGQRSGSPTATCRPTRSPPSTP